MVWIFVIAVKKIFLITSAILKFATTQNEPKRAETKLCNPQPATMIHSQFFLNMSTTIQILTITLLTEETLFT